MCVADRRRRQPYRFEIWLVDVRLPTSIDHPSSKEKAKGTYHSTEPRLTRPCLFFSFFNCAWLAVPLCLFVLAGALLSCPSHCSPGWIQQMAKGVSKASTLACPPCPPSCLHRSPGPSYCFLLVLLIYQLPRPSPSGVDDHHTARRSAEGSLALRLVAAPVVTAVAPRAAVRVGDALRALLGLLGLGGGSLGLGGCRTWGCVCIFGR